MKRNRLQTLLGVLVGTLLLGLGAVSGHAATSQEDGWGQPSDEIQSGMLVGASMAADAGATQIGQADVDLEAGTVHFKVNRLAGLVSVQGVVVCNLSAGAEATLVETPAVPVTGHGEATFAGHMAFPPECLHGADNMGFLIRTVR